MVVSHFFFSWQNEFLIKLRTFHTKNTFIRTLSISNILSWNKYNLYENMAIRGSRVFYWFDAHLGFPLASEWPLLLTIVEL